MTQAKRIAQRLAEAVMFLPGPLTKHHAAPLLVRRDDIADMLLGAGLREMVAALEEYARAERISQSCREAGLADGALKTTLLEDNDYNAADDPEIRAALQRTVNGDG